MKFVVPLADGFEEIEAVTIIDILRRGGLDVTTASVAGNPVKGSHGISVTADAAFSDLDPSGFDGIVLPGGMPGSKNLRENGSVLDFVKAVYSRGGYTAAVCAAPTVLFDAGILKGKKVTVYPADASYITDVTVVSDPVVVDGHIITGKSAGAAIDFALAIVRECVNADTARKLRTALQVYWNE